MAAAPSAGCQLDRHPAHNMHDLVVPLFFKLPVYAVLLCAPFRDGDIAKSAMLPQTLVFPSRENHQRQKHSAFA
jgi:hypothetical protein